MTAAELERLLAPGLEALGLALWGIEVSGSGKGTTIRVYIDSEDGVTVDDCERASRQISAELDVEDPVPGQYRLEVSSPGLDRRLFRREHYAESIGETVDVRLIRAFEGRRRLQGVLRFVADDEVTVVVGDTAYDLPLEWIRRAQIVPRFD